MPYCLIRFWLDAISPTESKTVLAQIQGNVLLELLLQTCFMWYFYFICCWTGTRLNQDLVFIFFKIKQYLLQSETTDRFNSSSSFQNNIVKKKKDFCSLCLEFTWPEITLEFDDFHIWGQKRREWNSCSFIFTRSSESGLGFWSGFLPDIEFSQIWHSYNTEWCPKGPVEESNI